MLLAYLRKLGLPYQISNDNELEEDFRAQAAKLITIESISALSDNNFNFTGQTQGVSSPLYATKVAQSLKNLKERKLRGVDLTKVLDNAKVSFMLSLSLILLLLNEFTISFNWSEDIF